MAVPVRTLVMMCLFLLEPLVNVAVPVRTMGHNVAVPVTTLGHVAVPV